MTDYATHPDWLALLRGVCEEPDGDLPRLVAADWLEERGHGDRAEFIRVQVEQASLPGQSRDCPEWLSLEVRTLSLLGNAPPGEYLPKYWEWFARDLPMAGWWGPRIRRGFAESVEVRLDDFVGGAFPGFAESLFRSHPITDVEIKDATPYYNSVTGRWIWLAAGTAEAFSPAARTAVLPSPIFYRIDTFHDRHVGFAGSLAAYAALSRSCVAYGRVLAGLPALHDAVPA